MGTPVVFVTAALLAVAYCLGDVVDPNTLTGNVTKFLEEYDKQASQAMYKSTEAEWGYATNLTDYNKQFNVSR